MANSRSILTLSASEISYDEAVTEANLKYFENKISEKLYSPIVEEGDFKIKQVPIFRSTDQLMKHYAFNTPISKIARCNPKTCFNKGECISQFTLDNIMHLKEEFWGSECSDAPSTSVRRGLILHILRNAYRKKNDTFEFPITNFDKNNKIICESAFLIALGLSNHPNHSKAPQQWRNLKKYVSKGYDTGGLDLSYSYSQVRTKISRDDKEPRRIKFEHCVTFIVFFTKHYGDLVSDYSGN